ncbi:MAG: hypothetical protein AAFS13_07230 [Pseudomonadota bacterium]
MTGTTNDNGDTPEPIDADFEPAPPTADYVSASSEAASGPGWIALGMTGAAAALFGGLLAGGLSSTGNGEYAPQALAGEVESLAANQQAVEASIETLRATIADAEARLERETAAEAASSGDDEALATLTAEIETLNERLDALQVGENDLDGLTDLTARVDVLERADEDEVTSPRLANRAITALRTRVEEIEDAQAQITNRQAIRAEALADLLSRMESIEAVAGEEAAQEIVALRAEFDALKESIATDDGQSAEIQSLQETVDQLREQGNADSEDTQVSRALFALLTIEAAAGDGRSFQSAHAQMLEALPGNATVSALAPLATEATPTIAMLQSRFDETATDALQAIVDAESETDGWDWLRNIFGEDLELRRSGAPVGPEDTLEAARASLQAQDLRGSVDLIETLEGPSTVAFESWLADANQRLTLDESLDALRLVLLGAER